jgi:hypothetical protein
MCDVHLLLKQGDKWGAGGATEFIDSANAITNRTPAARRVTDQFCFKL